MIHEVNNNYGIFVRMAKYNQLLRIEEELGDEAVYGYTKIYRK